MENSVFECTMCGQCCEGQGGIVVSPTDLERLCAHFQLSAQAFEDQYGCVQNGKLKVRTGADNFCIFFKDGVGCAAHVARPDICRAWPFFRGNMVDNESFYLSKDYCPGLRADSTHAEFVAEGAQYLQDNGLRAKDAKTEAHALLPFIED